MSARVSFARDARELILTNSSWVFPAIHRKSYADARRIFVELISPSVNLSMDWVAPEGVVEEDINDAERIGLKRMFEFLDTGSAYSREHGTRPATIGFVLSASPLSLLAW